MAQYRRMHALGGQFFLTVVTERRRPLFASAANVGRLRRAVGRVRRARGARACGAPRQDSIERKACPRRMVELPAQTRSPRSLSLCDHPRRLSTGAERRGERRVSAWPGTALDAVPRRLHNAA